MSPRHRLLLVLTTALIALLIFAATAAAEVRIGEATSPAKPSLNGQLDLLKVTASYDSSSGALEFAITTRELKEEAGFESLAAVFDAEGPCDAAALDGPQEPLPFYELAAPYAKPTKFSDPEARYDFVETTRQSSIFGPASQSVQDQTTVLAASVPEAAGRAFDCAAVQPVDNNVSERDGDLLIFPIAVQPPPAPEKIVEIQTVTKTVNVPGPTATVTPPPAAPAALALSRIKPVDANDQKWTTVRLAVTNTGGTASGPVAIKVKTPAGVIVKPGSLRLPALLPGQSWTLPVRVKATEKAKRTSTVGLTATLPGITTTSSFTVKNTA